MSSKPGTEEIRAELKRRQTGGQLKRILLNTVSTLIVVAAVAVLCVTLWLPFLRIYGNSMNPTLTEGQIAITVKTKKVDRGDIVYFYNGNKLLVKRCIAKAGDYVDIDDKGNVSVNGKLLSEPYVSKKQPGDIDIELPYKVKEGDIFVLGDQRSVSTDSRNSAVGCVSEEQLMGRVVFVVWPLSSFGKIK